MNYCPHCGNRLKFEGFQDNVIDGTVFTLETCTNPMCASTFTTHIRSMTLQELAKHAETRSRLGLE